MKKNSSSSHNSIRLSSKSFLGKSKNAFNRTTRDKFLKIEAVQKP